MWFDSHFHIDDDDDAIAILQVAREANVGYFMILGTSLENCPRTVALANPEQGVYVAVGMHPETAESYQTDEPFREWLKTPGACAVGEIGLDYYYDTCERSVQRYVFEEMINLAQELKLPAVVHCRNAFDDCYDILKSNVAPQFRFLIHSFADTPCEAEKWLELGAMLSMNGMVTFNKADNIRESLKCIPLERLLIETDSPYLAPVPLRGRRNQPAFVPYVGARIAEEKGCTVDDVQRITTENALRFFGIA